MASHAPASRSAAHQAYAARTTADASPPNICTRPDAMKSMEIASGGPLMPRSKSLAIVRSVLSFGCSRWAMPGGSTQAVVSLSYSHAAVWLPRFAPVAWWSGART